jgi:peptidoglycan/xylan/chitin deacetylase (PgdA/CDA1 family)
VVAANQVMAYLAPAPVIGALAGLLVGTAVLGTPLIGTAAAADCPGNPDALGTSRTLVVDPAEHPKLGAMQYHESLPLEDHEIVITFDDGPLPPRSTAVLDTLDRECVKATFFLVGKMAHAFPDTVKRIRDAGHTIGTHSYSHPLTFHRMPLEKAQFEINQGIANVTAALGDGTGPAPFFRIPGLLRADGVERYAASQKIQVWSADFLADDWTHIGPQQVYARALQRIEAAHKGILLLHDIQPRTVEALPALLRELKRRGYKIVHVVPATAELPKTATEPGQWVVSHGGGRTSRTSMMESEPAFPPANPLSSGFDVGSTISFFEKISSARDPDWVPLTLARSGRPATSPAGSGGFEMALNLSDPFHMPEVAPRNADSAQLWPAPRPVDTVGEASGVVAVNEIQRLLESLPDETDEGPATPRSHGGPTPNAVMPRGAFP